MSQSFQTGPRTTAEPQSNTATTSTLIAHGCTGDEAALQQLHSLLAELDPHDAQQLYEPFCAAVAQLTSISPSGITSLFSFAEKIEELVFDESEQLLRNLCALAKKLELSSSRREGLSRLGSLLQERDEDNLSDIERICAEALGIAHETSLPEILVTLDIYCTLASAQISQLEGERALKVVPKIDDIFGAHEIPLLDKLKEPFPHEQDVFRIVVKSLQIRAEILSDNNDFETADDLLSDLHQKLLTTKTYPATLNIVQESRIQVAASMAKVNLKWGQHIEDEANNAEEAVSCYLAAGESINYAMHVLSGCPNSQLNRAEQAELWILKGEIELTGTETAQAQKSFEKAQILLAECEEDGFVEGLMERLSEGLGTCEDLATGDAEGTDDSAES